MIKYVENLPNQGATIDFKPTSPKNNFFNQLPQEFERKKAVEIGKGLKIQERTVYYHLSKLEKAGYYIKQK